MEDDSPISFYGKDTNEAESNRNLYNLDTLGKSSEETKGENENEVSDDEYYKKRSGENGSKVSEDESYKEKKVENGSKVSEDESDKKKNGEDGV